jgi:hypothetical protein
MSRTGRYMSSCISLSFLLAICRPARADNVSLIFGGGAYAGQTQQQLYVSGGSGSTEFSVSSIPPDGPGSLGIGTVGVPITFSWGSVTVALPEYTQGSFGSYNTSIILGGLSFTGTSTVPASALTIGSFTTPMSVVGDFQAFQEIDLGGGFVAQGPLLGSVHLQGQASVVFTIRSVGGNQFMFDDATATFTGTGTETTVTPEPASLLLVGTGLSGLALKIRKRRRLIG